MSRPSVKIPRHLKQLARRARAEGWTIEVAGNGHLRWRPPHGPAVMTGATPKSYGQAPHIERQKLAKAGLKEKAA